MPRIELDKRTLEALRKIGNDIVGHLDDLGLSEARQERLAEAAEATIRSMLEDGE